MNNEKIKTFFFNRDTSVDYRGKLLAAIQNMSKDELRNALVVAIEEAHLISETSKSVSAHSKKEFPNINFILNSFGDGNRCVLGNQSDVIKGAAFAELKKLILALDEKRFADIDPHL